MYEFLKLVVVNTKLQKNKIINVNFSLKMPSFIIK